MYNWDYNIKKGWKPQTDEEWRWYLTRIITYGLDNVKIDPVMVAKYLPELKIDTDRRRFLEFLLKDHEKNTDRKTETVHHSAQR